MSADWWTLGIQFLNVAILMWILAHFFWKPVARMIDKRRDQVDETLANAEKARRKVEAAQADVARVRAGFDAEREEVLSRAREEAREAKDNLLAQARNEAERIRQDAEEATRRERASAERAWADSASRLAVEIARRLLSTTEAGQAQAGLLDGLMEELSGLSDRQRSHDAGDRLQVTSAVELSPEERETCREGIRRALGADWAMDFVVDPELLAGFEVTGPSFTVRNSWRSALSRIRKELDRGDLT